MQLSKDIKKVLRIGDESVAFTLRQPTNKELNDFLADRYEFGRKGKMKDNTLQARVDFFDSLLTGVDDLIDPEGAPVAPDRKELIPANWKSTVVFSAFEDMEVDEKN